MEGSPSEHAPGAAAAPEAAAAAPVPPLTARHACLGLAVFLGTQLAAGLLVGIAAVVATARRGGDASRAATPTIIMVATLAGSLAGGAFTWALVRHWCRGAARVPRATALGLALGSRRQVLGALALGIACGSGLVVAVHAWPPPADHQFGPMARAVGSGALALALWVALAVLVAPPVEELVFRGVLLAGFARTWGGAVAAPLVTLLFVLLHLTETGRYAPAIAGVTVIGVLALAVRVRSGALGPAVALHVAYNGVLATFVVASGAG
jgi:membrane protease YdiL (CAAX protease family)